MRRHCGHWNSVLSQVPSVGVIPGQGIPTSVSYRFWAGMGRSPDRETIQRLRLTSFGKNLATRHPPSDEKYFKVWPKCLKKSFKSLSEMFKNIFKSLQTFKRFFKHSGKMFKKTFNSLNF